MRAFSFIALLVLVPFVYAAGPFKTRSEEPLAQGIHLVRVSDGKELYKLNDSEPLCPASISKLITTATLLAQFGPSRTFSTEIYQHGERVGGTIKGDLVIVGDGDPLFVSENLWQIAADLRNLGIRRVQGNLILDTHLFDNTVRDLSRLEGEDASNHAYDAPVTALGVNFNTVAVAVAPGLKVGQVGLVNLDPYPNNAVELENHIKTVGPKAKTHIEVKRISLNDGRSKIVVAGQIAFGSELQKIYRSVNDPILSSGEIVRSFLKGGGIELSGKILEGRLPASNTKWLHTHTSKPVSAIVQSLNLYSSNYIADVMVKRLGAEFPVPGSEVGVFGTYKHGIDIMDRFLRQEVGWKGAYTLKNGSGLDTANRVTAQQMTQLLTFVAKRWDIFPDFLASLPVAGISGTLEKRFKKHPADKLQGMLRAKTGTLSDPIAVSTLAGYFFHPVHQLVAFAILQNGVLKRTQPNILEMHESQELGLANLIEKGLL